MSSTTMRAWVHTTTGLPSKVLILSTIPLPSTSTPTQVLVKVSHCALNPGPSIIMQLLPFIFRASQAIPEMDFSGEIVGTGSNMPPERGLVVGTKVFGSVPLAQHVKSTSGALAEYIVLDCAAVVKKPPGISLGEAAGLGIAGCTALDLVKAAKVKRGDSVLVNGASGGIGHLALQMCREKVGETGKVVAVCSSSNVRWVKELGADEIIAYDEHAPVHSYLVKAFGASKFDAIVDAVGIQDIFNTCPQYLAEGHPYVTVGPRQPSFTIFGMLSSIGSMAQNFLWPQILGGVPRTYVQVAAKENLEAMQELAAMVEDGTLSVHVGAEFNMMDTLGAFDRLLGGHAEGKIVVEVGKIAQTKVELGTALDVSGW